jgi:two-component system, cell cycle sensor histidine kinase and response regulator CckA
MAESLRILILEDNPVDAELIQFEMQEGGIIFTSQVVMTEAGFVRELQEFSPDLILSDYDLPRYNGALALAEAKRTCPDTPFILITGAVSEDRAIEILTQGAKDYVLKNRMQQRLVPAIRRALAETSEHRARKQAEADLREAHNTLEERVKIRTRELQVEIGERQQAEDELRASQQIIEGIINSIPVRVFWKDRNLVYLGCNTIFARDAGFADPKDIIGKNDYQLVWHDQAALYRSDDRQVIASGVSKFFVEEPHKTPAGKIITLLMSKMPLRNATGEISGILGTYLDITDRKKTEEEKQILTERLQRAEKMEALGTLAGGVAHELNNILGITIGYAEMLMDKIDESSSLREDLTKILEGGLRSAAIIQDLLALARSSIQTRKVINLNTVILDCQKTPAYKNIFLLNPDINTETGLDADLLNITGSPAHLGKTIIELVANAVEAMPGGGTLTITTSNQTLDKPGQGYDTVAEGDYVVLSITDTGTGIPDSELKHIFEPFYTKRALGKRGPGLGIAVVWSNVKDHHGYIDVQSEVGKGTTFTLYFPVTREEQAKRPMSLRKPGLALRRELDKK